GGLAADLAALPAAQARAATLEWVRDQVAVVLGHTSGAGVDVDQAFAQLGFDSLIAVELCNRLAAATGLRLASTLVFSYPTLRELSEHLYGLLRPADTAPAAQEEQAAAEEEAAIRQALASVPIAGLRAAGVLDVILACAAAADPATPADTDAAAGAEDGEELSDLDLEALVDLALDEKR
ncbi:MAG: acyl carrier protein, partial [Streptomyces sp.]|nr:acyl carrier protein [Streptomyces sp.]